MKVHPAAECFRSMREDELADLAETIRENGLRDAITLGRVNGSKTEVLVDGRNRLKACEMAGIEPRFETIEFQDDDAVRAFVRDRGERRDVTKGERAMAVAMLYPEPEKGGRGKKGKASAFSDGLGISAQHAKDLLSNARAVLRHSEKLAKSVRDGDISLDDAFEQVRAKLEETDEVVEDLGPRMRKLRRERPDLAEKVTAKKLSLDDAETTAKKEADERKQQRWAATINIIDSARAFDRPVKVAADLAREYDAELAASRGEEITAKKLRRVAAFVEALAAAMEDIENA